jgi:epoxyqueuosine reductase
MREWVAYNPALVSDRGELISDERDRVARLLVAEAERAGFHRVGLAPVGDVPRHALYERWVADGYAGEMDYLARDLGPRRDPALLLENARTVVTVGLSYAHPDPPRPTGEGPTGTIARYARGADYHMVLKPRLARLADAIADRLGRPVAFRACVDTAPILEREAAHRGGVGFLAKNTMIIAPGLGSYLLLGELLLDVDASPTDAAEPRCGQCRACLDACPTGAFVDGYLLDARRCISYLTIESSGPIPRPLRRAVGDLVFGCDRCQEVCPFNAPVESRPLPADPALLPRPGRAHPSLVTLLGLGAARFRKWVQRTALRRIHRAQLLRNVAVALGNTGGPGEIAPLVRAFDEPSALVRGHVAWALGEIARRHPDSGAEAALRARQGVEPEPEVLEEIAAALEEAGSARTLRCSNPATPSTLPSTVPGGRSP